MIPRVWKIVGICFVIGLSAACTSPSPSLDGDGFQSLTQLSLTSRGNGTHAFTPSESPIHLVDFGNWNKMTPTMPAFPATLCPEVLAIAESLNLFQKMTSHICQVTSFSDDLFVRKAQNRKVTVQTSFLDSDSPSLLGIDVRGEDQSNVDSYVTHISRCDQEQGAKPPKWGHKNAAEIQVIKQEKDYFLHYDYQEADNKFLGRLTGKVIPRGGQFVWDPRGVRSLDIYLPNGAKQLVFDPIQNQWTFRMRKKEKSDPIFVYFELGTTGLSMESMLLTHVFGGAKTKQDAPVTAVRYQFKQTDQPYAAGSASAQKIEEVLQKDPFFSPQKPSHKPDIIVASECPMVSETSESQQNMGGHSRLRRCHPISSNVELQCPASL